MKKIFLLLAAVGMIFTACEGGDGVEEENGGAPFVPEITISPKDLTFGCNGGEQEVDVTANFEYEVVERASWIAVEQTDEGLLVVVETNKNTSERRAFISITNSQYDINKSIEVWQEGYVSKIELAQQSIEVEFEPAEYEVAVTSPYSWEATTKNDWIVIESETGIAGDEKLKFTTLRNEEEQERKGTITLKNTDYNIVAELYITQKAFAPDEIIIEPESLTFTSEGGTQEVVITANFEYAYSANADWLTIEKSEGGVKVTAQTNGEDKERTAEITISNKKYGISKTISVTQKGMSKNVIIYTSSDGRVVTPHKSDVFGANIVSNTYGNGQGVIIFDAPVTSIGKHAFYSCTSLTSVKIPDSITSIGKQAFDGCTSLTSVTIGNSVTSIGDYAFWDCTSLTSITIPDSVTSIGEAAFSGCTSLASIAIPDSVTSIEGATFSGCTSLKSVTIPDSVTTIGRAAFLDCTSLTSLTIPDSVTSIGDSAFRDCSSMTSVTIHGSVTTIGYQAFYNCGSLTSVTIPDSVTEIGDYAFYHCSSLTSVTFPDSITSIGEVAFSGCTSLTGITIPDSVTSIGDSAFFGCTSLTSVTIGNGVTKIGEAAFSNCTGELIVNCNIPSASSSDEGAFYNSKFTKVTIGDSVTLIGEYAFSGCTSLTGVTIPDSVTSVGNNAFYKCASLMAFYGKHASLDNRCLIINGVLNSFAPAGLTEYTIPDSVTLIGGSAFERCTSLTSVTIPNSVTSIGEDAFSDCYSLTSVYCKPTTPPTGGSYMFHYNASGRKIYVPRNSVNAYKYAMFWNSYASDIVGYDF